MSFKINLLAKTSIGTIYARNYRTYIKRKEDKIYFELGFYGGILPFPILSKGGDMKRKKLLSLFASIAMVAIWAGCGGSSSTPAATTASTASVESLSSIPTMDLSSYDSSEGASADITALLNQSKSITKGLGEGLRDVGKSSRAGCEANMHKKEVFRMSQQAQLDRCYAEAMETAGLITIPAGSYSIYSVTPPEMSAEEKAAMCANIPAERDDERAECEEGGEKTMLMRIGKFDNELRIDICSNKRGAFALNNEATYTASGTQYVADVVRKGVRGGNEEGGNFHVVVDLGTTGTVTDGIVTLGTDGLVNAAGEMVGGFGRGTITFERIGSDSSNKIYGTFIGGFTDPFSQTVTSFTGKAYSRFGGTANNGCAKFSFTGSPPAIPVVDAIPFKIPAGQEEAFVATLGAELGIPNLAITDKLCPNPNFDPEAENETDRPMTLLVGTSCDEVTDTGVECFGIVNGSETGSFGEVIITQTFTIIANTASSYYDEVNAFNLATLADPPANAAAIAFIRNWDCAGTATTVDFSGVDRSTIETAMDKCKAIEEKSRGNDGMGGYNCGKQEQMNGVNDMADEGGGAESFGAYGGELEFLNRGTCPENVSATLPQRLFVAPVNPAEKKYCFPLPDDTCSEFTLSGTPASASSLSVGMGGASITGITYTGENPPVGAQVTFLGEVSCDVNYTINRPEFTPGGGGFGGEGGGTAPGQQGFIPRPCIDAGLTSPEDENACEQLCHKPGVDCRP